MGAAQEILRSGRVDEALAELQTQVRNEPANSKHRVFLFQLLSVLGQWDRALTQLNVVGELDSEALPMVHTYREALQCEVLRAEIFAGRRSPLIFGDPEPWIARMVEAVRLGADGKHEEAARMREGALEQAEPSSGSVDGHAFEWIADADPRLGPLLETIVLGRYYWVPFRHIARIQLEAPEDLRDLVWMPAHFTWANGGQAVGMIPSRYPGTEVEGNPQTLLARETRWLSPAPDVFLGIGQRVLATDEDEYSLLNLRDIELHNSEPAEAEPGPRDG